MGFLSPYLLFLTSLALIPIIIHLIQRIRLKRIAYSSLFFITETDRQTFTWLAVKDILLLICRTLFVFFLVFSLARPFLRKKIFAANYVASRIIILDNSMSMSYRHNFELAKTEARNLIGELRKTSEAALLTSSGSVQTKLTPDLRMLANILDTISVTYDHTPLQPSFEKAVQLVDNAANPKKEIIIITDLQDHALRSILDLIAPVNQITQYDLLIISIGEKSAENVGIAEIFTDPSFPSPDFPCRPLVKILNYSDKSQNRILSFSLQHTKNDSLNFNIQKEISLNPHEQRPIAIDVLLSVPGTYRLQTSLNHDSLPADDQNYYTLTIQEKKKILLIADNSTDEKYIAQALASGSFEIDYGSIQSLYQQNPAHYAAVGILNPARLASRDWQRLAGYLRTGGGIFITINEDIKDPNWTQSLNLEFSVTGSAVKISPPGFIQIQQVNYQRPVMEIFNDIDLTNARFFSYWKTEQIPNQSALALFSQATPLLAQSDWQKIILAFTSFEPRSTDLVYKATFVPLMHRIFTYLSSPAISSSYLVNDTIITTQPAQFPIKIKTPFSEFLQTPVKEENRFAIRFSETGMPGFYELGDNLFSVNVSSEESNLSRIPAAQLKSRQIQVRDQTSRKTYDLTNFALLLALIFLIGEFVLLIL